MCGVDKVSAAKTSKAALSFEKFKSGYKGALDISHAFYIGSKAKVMVVCKHHGAKYMRPSHLMNGHECIECGYQTSSKKQQASKEYFVLKANKRHNNKYTYDLENYTGLKSLVSINCPNHGWFLQLPSIHLMGHGCRDCANERIAVARSMSNESFLRRAKATHLDRYNYRNVIYKRCRAGVWIECKTHGMFLQKPEDHLRGHGCQKCGFNGGALQAQIADFCRSITSHEVVDDYTDIPECTEVDIYIPELDLAIEVNGLKFHSMWDSQWGQSSIIKGKPKNYHLQKTKTCAGQGVQLLHIWEDEWRDKRDIIESCLKNKLGVTGRAVYARKTEVRVVSSAEANELIESWHLLGKCSLTTAYGLYTGDELVSVMAFKRGASNVDYDWNLTRFCSLANTRVVGGASKLLKAFRASNPGSIVTFAERRWSDGHLYLKLGFTFDKYTSPDYKYTDYKYRYHKFGFRHALLDKKLSNYDSCKSETENMREHGWNQVFDCGLIRYFLK
jgi:hypothetical protein